MTQTDRSCERTPLLVTVRSEEVHGGNEDNAGFDTRDLQDEHARSVSSDIDVKGEPFNIKPLVAISFIGLVQPVCFELIFPFISKHIGSSIFAL